MDWIGLDVGSLDKVLGVRGILGLTGRWVDTKMRVSVFTICHTGQSISEGGKSCSASAPGNFQTIQPV